jgi:uncharacterized protein (UPF0548 family)
MLRIVFCAVSLATGCLIPWPNKILRRVWDELVLPDVHFGFKQPSNVTITGKSQTEDYIMHSINFLCFIERLEQYVRGKNNFDTLKLTVDVHTRCDQRHEFNVKILQVVVGKGRDIFQKYSQQILDLTLTDKLGWAFIAKPPNWYPHQNCTIATVTRFYSLPVWTINPCRIHNIEEYSPVDGGVRSRISYYTVQGHLLQGEESFSVTLQEQQPDKPVLLEIVSISKGCGLLGKILMPLVRPLQRRFLDGHRPLT